MPGAPILHGYSTSASPAGEGGVARIGLVGVPKGGSWSFILWLVIVGVILPGLILGGLKVGGFEFVFRNRR